jgi:excisionase family DNA binding protein
MNDGQVEAIQADAMNTRDVARYLKKSERWTGEKARKGVIPSTKIGGSRMFSRRKITEWFEKRFEGEDGNGKPSK